MLGPYLIGARNLRMKRCLFPKNTVHTWKPDTAEQAGTQRIGIRQMRRWWCGRANSLIPERSSRWRYGQIGFMRASKRLMEVTPYSCCRSAKRAPEKL